MHQWLKVHRWQTVAKEFMAWCSASGDVWKKLRWTCLLLQVVSTHGHFRSASFCMLIACCFAEVLMQLGSQKPCRWRPLVHWKNAVWGRPSWSGSLVNEQAFSSQVNPGNLEISGGGFLFQESLLRPPNEQLSIELKSFWCFDVEIIRWVFAFLCRNQNRISHFPWLEDILKVIVDGKNKVDGFVLRQCCFMVYYDVFLTFLNYVCPHWWA